MARLWATAYNKPVITFDEVIDEDIPREDKRTRKAGQIVQDVKNIVTPTEIGKATILTTDTSLCDSAAENVVEDMANVRNQEQTQKK